MVAVIGPDALNRIDFIQYRASRNRGIEMDRHGGSISRVLNAEFEVDQSIGKQVCFCFTSSEEKSAATGSTASTDRIQVTVSEFSMLRPMRLSPVGIRTDFMMTCSDPADHPVQVDQAIHFLFIRNTVIVFVRFKQTDDDFFRFGPAGRGPMVVEKARVPIIGGAFFAQKRCREPAAW